MQKSAKEKGGVNEVGGKIRAGPALNPLKGSSARPPPSGRYIRTRLAKPKPLKYRSFPQQAPVKTSRPRKKCRRREGAKHVVNRGVALYKGRVYLGALDGRLIALDAKTGTVAWEEQTTPKDGPYAITGAPRIAKGRV